jgi:hypothetical protein
MDARTPDLSCHDMILERFLDVSQGDLQASHPMILSCGGVFVPRPPMLNPRDPLYHILHTPNRKTPTKIVSALVTRDLLDEILLRLESN